MNIGWREAASVVVKDKNVYKYVGLLNQPRSLTI